MVLKNKNYSIHSNVPICFMSWNPKGCLNLFKIYGTIYNKNVLVFSRTCVLIFSRTLSIEYWPQIKLLELRCRHSHILEEEPFLFLTEEKNI